MRSPLLTALAVLLLSVGARAGEEDDVLTGHATAGYRYVTDDDEGRYPQDVNLTSGLRLFDLGVDWQDLSGDAFLSDGSLTMSGVGDPWSDYLLSFRKDTTFTLDAGYRRDEFDYQATGGPWPYDTTRERSYIRITGRPVKRLSLRAEWHRSRQTGEARTSEFTDDREFVPGEDQDLTVRDQRPIDRVFDTFVLGGDYRIGRYRIGLTETIRIGSVDDVRIYDVPATVPLRQDFSRDLSSQSYFTHLWGGGSFFENALDVTLFLDYLHAPRSADIDSTNTGFDNSFYEGAPKGPFRARTTGGTDNVRNAAGARLEALWRVGPTVEVTLGLEARSTKDDVHLDLVEHRTFEDGTIPEEVERTSVDDRITYDERRAYLEVLWEITEAVRLRAGEEYYREEFDDPKSSKGDSFDPLELSARTWRTTVGVDVEPTRGLTIGALGRLSRDSEPSTSVSARDATEISVRGLYRPGGAWTAAVTWRRRAIENDEEFDSRSTADSVGATVSGAGGPVTGSASLTWQNLDTKTTTSVIDSDLAFTRIDRTVTFTSRSWIADIDLRWSVTSSSRIGLGAIGSFTRGTYRADAGSASARFEYDLSKALTAGTALRGWWMNELARSVDDYASTGLELFLTYRF